MEIFRTQRPEILRWVLPHIVADEESTQEAIIEFLLTLMISKPEDICVAIAIDGEELIGCTIGWIVRNHVWLGQSYLDSAYDREVGLEAIDIVKDWGREKNLIDIRFETKRSAKALSRAWGFEEYSSIMRMEL